MFDVFLLLFSENGGAQFRLILFFDSVKVLFMNVLQIYATLAAMMSDDTFWKPIKYV